LQEILTTNNNQANGQIEEGGEELRIGDER